MLLRHVGRGPITAGDVPEIERPSAECGPADWRSPGFEMALRAAVSAGIGLKNIGRAAEDAAVRIAVDEANGSLTRAAERLGVTPRAIQLRRAVTRMLSMTLPSPDTQMAASDE